MAVGLKFTTSPRRLAPRRSGMNQAGAQIAPLSKSQPTSPLRPAPSATVKRLPNTRTLPLWVRSLIGVQRGLSILTWGLAAAVLSVYGQTVYSQQLWSQEYRKLENLQRDERQLTATSEVLKNQMAQQAETARAGLVPSNPANTIFLQPAPQRPAPVLDPLPTAPNPQPPAPLGY